MKRIILVVFSTILAAGFLQADVYIKNMTRTGTFEMMGRKTPEKVEIEERWLSKDKFSVSTKELTILGDLEKKQIYFIVHKLKQYFQLPMDIKKEELGKFLPPHIADIITSIKISGVKAGLTGERKKIANWDCRASDLEMTFMIPAVNMMPSFKIRMWTTDDLPFDHKKYTGGLEEFFGEFIMELCRVDENAKKEFEKLEKVTGFQVAAEVTVSLFGQDIKTDSQCLEVTEKAAPAGTYQVPGDYKRGTFPTPAGPEK